MQKRKVLLPQLIKDLECTVLAASPHQKPKVMFQIQETDTETECHGAVLRDIT